MDEGGVGEEFDYFVLEFLCHAFRGGGLGEEEVLQGVQFVFADAFVELLFDEVAEGLGGVDFRSQGIVGPGLDADEIVREAFGALAYYP